MLRNLNQLSKILRAKPFNVSIASFHSSKVLKNPDNFLNGTNSVYLEQMYDNWVKDKSSVHPSWDAYFSNVTSGLTGEQAFVLPPTLGQSGALGSQTRVAPSRGPTATGDMSRSKSLNPQSFSN